MRLHEMGFNIQSHGVRHKNMSALIDEELQDDLCTSKTYFERLLGKTVDSVLLSARILFRPSYFRIVESRLSETLYFCTGGI